jgi:hypothetical protein
MIPWKTLIIGAVVIATTLLTAAAFARGTAVASMVVAETCSDRIAPGSQAAITATVRNSGDEALHQVRVDADAGTPENEADDFFLTRTVGDDLLDPGETWTFVGSYRVRNADSTNVVNGEALSPTNIPVDDLEACATDVIQPPVPGVRAGVVPVRGTVMIKLPGSNRFVKLDGQTEIPIGAQVDARKGAVRLISGTVGGTQAARASAQSAVFFDGLFTIRQKRSARAVMTLVLGGGNFGVCRGGGSAQSVGATPRRPVRRLWGSGKGRFSTRARYSAATVRGTRWLTQDRCDGTFTRVTQGVVSVQDFRLRRTRVVKAGQSYLARAPGR